MDKLTPGYYVAHHPDMRPGVVEYAPKYPNSWRSINDDPINDPRNAGYQLVALATALNSEKERALDRAAFEDAIREIDKDRAQIREELDRAREGLGDGVTRPHNSPEDCPTYYDGCNCTVETMMFNIKRCAELEKRLAALDKTISFHGGPFPTTEDRLAALNLRATAEQDRADTAEKALKAAEERHKADLHAAVQRARKEWAGEDRQALMAADQPKNCINCGKLRCDGHDGDSWKRCAERYRAWTIANDKRCSDILRRHGVDPESVSLRVDQAGVEGDRATLTNILEDGGARGLPYDEIARFIYDLGFRRESTLMKALERLGNYNVYFQDFGDAVLHLNAMIRIAREAAYGEKDNGPKHAG